MSKLRVGVIGCGNISGIYFKGGYRFRNYEIVAAADMVDGKAEAKVQEIKGKAEEWKIKIDKLPTVMSVKELLGSPDVELVLNLTIPKAHAEIAIAALEAGKHTYHEKPFACSREDGKKIMEVARRKNLRVGCAPDTFLGAGHQTARKLIDDDWIGTPVAATAFMTCPGHESWHPDPEFYYAVGGGPMFDMGPYYLTALVNMMGPAKRVSAMAKATYAERTITSAPKYGKKVTVETPTHITGSVEFASGAIATLIMSFDIHAANLPRIEVYGSRGSLAVPDPNGFGGAVKVRLGRAFAAPYGHAEAGGWTEVAHTHTYADNSRGLGVADMVNAIRTNRPHRANGELAMHVLDIMQSFLDAAASGKTVELSTSCERPAALPMGLREGEMD